MNFEDVTLRLTCPPHDKLCFNGEIFSFVFYLEKFKQEQESILSGKNSGISNNFRLLMYLLSRNHYLFEPRHIYNELTNTAILNDPNSSVTTIFENHRIEIAENLNHYFQELLSEGYLDFLFVSNSENE